MFVSLFQLNLFGTGLYVPYFHERGPFSCKKPARLEHPGPPFTGRSRQRKMTPSSQKDLHHIVISSLAAGSEEGEKKKYSLRDSLASCEIGS